MLNRNGSGTHIREIRHFLFFPKIELHASTEKLQAPKSTTFSRHRDSQFFPMWSVMVGFVILCVFSRERERTASIFDSHSRTLVNDNLYIQYLQCLMINIKATQFIRYIHWRRAHAFCSPSRACKVT